MACVLPGATGPAMAGAPAYATVQATSEVVRWNVPDYFFGFNIPAGEFENRFWNPVANAPMAGMVEAMQAFKGCYLRYPGGTEANMFSSDWAVGPAAQRPRQRLYDWLPAAPVLFGPAEFFKFAASIGARTWYTLNLSGWHQDFTRCELPSAEVAAANARLAALRVQLDPGDEFGRIYHLGNELDRGQFEWPVEKYLARCQDTMAAVRAVDPKARFVGFLRDFDYPYTTRSGVSKGVDFSLDVLNRLPPDTDGSFHIYYDRPASEGSRMDLTWRWKLTDNYFSALAAGGKGNTGHWITEHAACQDLSAQNLSQRERLATTSGITGALASADFMLGAIKRPKIRGTMLHALGGGVWWGLFDKINGILVPTPSYAVFKLLRKYLQGDVLKNAVLSSNVDAYSGGYDVNAAVLRVNGGAVHKVFVVNRAASAAAVTLSLPALAGKLVQSGSEHVAAARAPGSWLDEMFVTSGVGAAELRAVNSAGQLMVNVAPRSLTVLRLTLA